MIQEFKDFVNKGGVVEAAVGLIMALAFKPIVDSLVADVIMPVVGRIFGTPDFAGLKINLGGDSVPNPDNPDEMIEAAIYYGKFINTIISFVIIALVIFLMVRAYNKTQPDPEPEVDGPSEVDLLTEIRDGLKR